MNVPDEFPNPDECPWCAQPLPNQALFAHVPECNIANSGNMGLMMGGVQRYIQQLANEGEE